MASNQEYPTYTKNSPQTRVRERLGRIETRGGKRFFVPAKIEDPTDTGPFLTPEEKARLAKLHASKSPINGKRRRKSRLNFHQRAAIKAETIARRSDKAEIERALALKAKGYLHL